MRLHKGFTSSSETDEVPIPLRKRDWVGRMWYFIIQETQAVSLWSMMAMTLRLVLVVLGMMAISNTTQSQDGVSNNQTTAEEGLYLGNIILREQTSIRPEWFQVGAVLSDWLLALLPSKVRTLQSPGFIFANPLLLLWVRDRTGVIPNVPIRVCEYVMGRISLLQLIIVFPIHLATVISTSAFLKRVFPGSLDAVVLEPIVYADDVFPSVVDLAFETLTTAVFTVALLAIPVFFQLNHVPRWSLMFLWYPLFNYAIDSNGMTNSFAPNVVLALDMLGQRPMTMGFRLAASMMGGILGGRIMKSYFPDN